MIVSLLIDKSFLPLLHRKQFSKLLERNNRSNWRNLTKAKQLQLASDIEHACAFSAKSFMVKKDMVFSGAAHCMLRMGYCIKNMNIFFGQMSTSTITSSVQLIQHWIANT